MSQCISVILQIKISYYILFNIIKLMIHIDVVRFVVSETTKHNRRSYLGHPYMQDKKNEKNNMFSMKDIHTMANNPPLVISHLKD